MSEVNDCELDSFLTLEAAIVLQGGTVIEVKDFGGGSMHSQDGKTRCAKNIMFDRIIDFEQVAYVEVCGVRADLP